MKVSKMERNANVCNEAGVFEPTSEVANIEELSSTAVFHSVSINLTDKLNDPIHYSLGMWGKLILLGTIKHQGMKQHVDPERNGHELNWDNISHEVVHRALPKVQSLLSANACLRWYENRLRLYKERFPNYHYHGAMIDQLVRHYSHQLTTLTEVVDRFGININRLYWENLHALPPPSGATVVDQSTNQSAVSFSFTYEEIFQNFKLHSPSFCSVEVKTCNDSLQLSGSTKVETDLKRGSPLIGELKSPVSIPRSNKTVCSLGLKSSNVNGSVSFPGSYHAVIEHDISGKYPPSMTPGPGMKRAHSEDSSQDFNTCLKRPQVQGKEQTLLMLSILWKLKEGKGLFPDMFRTVATRMGENPCEFAIARMEEKVHSGEITDVKDLMKSCRCLVLLHTVLQNERKIPKIVRELLASLLEDTPACK